MSPNVKFNTMKLVHALRDIPSSVLTANEKYLLFLLISCSNQDNLSWRCMDSLVELSGLSKSTLRRVLRSLEQKMFIYVQQPSHHTHKKTNTYSLNMEKIYSSVGSVDKPEIVDKSGVTLTAPDQVGCHSDADTSRSGVTQTPHRVSHRHLKKEREKEKEKRENAREEPRFALSVFFEPNETIIFKARDRGLTMAEFITEMETLIEEREGQLKTTDEWNEDLRRWINRAIVFKQNKMKAKTAA